jgi:hypothetical protein
MVQRGLYYAASMVMICAIGAALLQLAMQILILSSPLADGAAVLAAAAIGVNSLRRRRRTVAKHYLVAGAPVARPVRPVRCRVEPRREAAGQTPSRDRRQREALPVP